MGDRLGTLGAVGITFYIAILPKGRWNKRLKFEFVLRGPVVKYQNVGTSFLLPRYTILYSVGFIKGNILTTRCPSSGGHILKLERYRED